MSSIVSSITGTAGGAGGTGFQTPQNSNLLNPATVGQANQLYDQNQDAINRQTDFLNALQTQNGIGNQNAVFNQLQGVADGTGPNPAKAQLAQATGANAANTAAQIASARGSSANPGLATRSAAQAGANLQQQNAGQAATMQANQSLNALNQLGGIAGQQVQNQAAATGANTGAVQGEQGQILGSIQGQNNASVGSTGSVNTGNTQLANTRFGQQGSVIGGLGQAIGPAIGALGMGAEGGRVMYADGTPPAGAQPAAPQIGAQSSFGKYMNAYGKNMQQKNDPNKPQQQEDPLAKGVTAIGKGIGQAASNYWGKATAPSVQAPAVSDMSGTSSGQTGIDASATPAPDSTTPVNANMPDMSGIADALADGGQPDIMGLATKLAPLILAAAKGGKVPVLLSPGEKRLTHDDLNKVKAGANPMAVGKTVPGKPKVGGAKNDYANDTYKTEAEPGEVIIPRSITKQPKSVRDKKAEAFVAQYLAQGGRVKGMAIFASKKAK